MRLLDIGPLRILLDPLAELINPLLQTHLWSPAQLPQQITRDGVPCQVSVKYFQIFLVESPEIMSWSGAVEVHQFILEILTHRLCNHVGQLEIIKLILSYKIKLGTLGSTKVSFMFVILGQGEDEEETISNILGVNISSGSWLGLAGVSMNGHLEEKIDISLSSFVCIKC